MARSKKSFTEKYNAPFAVRLRKLIHDKNITQDVLAQQINKSRQTVSQYVNGESEPVYTTLVKIADFFQVSTDYLLGRTNTKSVSGTEQAVIAYTGLSEDNVRTLHEMAQHSHTESLILSHDRKMAMSGNKPFLDCLNDLFDAMSNNKETWIRHYVRLKRATTKNETVDFWYVSGEPSGPIPGLEAMRYSDPKAQVDFDNETVEYDCMKIAKMIETSLLSKYLGTPQDIEQFKQDVDRLNAQNEAIRLEAIRRRDENGND